MEDKRKKLKLFLITTAIAFGIGTVVFCLMFFINGMGLIYATDGTALASLILLSTSGLVYVSRNGFFDIFSYGFKQLGAQLFSKNPTQYRDFAGYKENKRVVRSAKYKFYIPFLYVGLVFLAAAITLLFIYRSRL